MIGISLANLAEIKEDWDMWQYAHELLTKSGFSSVSNDLWRALTPNHPFQVLAPHPAQMQIESQITREKV
jgi:hypothetical protein